MGSVYDTLLERGFIKQATHEDEIKKLLASERVTFYIGFDPTADSLTVGHFVALMAMTHMQRAGHRPICLIGGGTTMIGDPTDKTDMRRIMTREEVAANAERFKKQISRFLDFSEGGAIMVDNADWLLNLEYVPFLREIGVHFTVNRMLAADCYKTRYERGLSFLEFNYMLMQSYDFLRLSREYGCKMQLGGDDQWSNIIGGVELIRRADDASAYGMTFTLLTTAEGKKMGKTQAGAIWLDPEKTSPFEFFQYFRNTDDRDVKKCLALLTFLPMDEVERLGALKDGEINRAKEVLAYELTKIVHGEDAAASALAAAKALFEGGENMENVPAIELAAAEIEAGMSIVELLERCALISSRGEGRRLLQQGGVKLFDVKIEDFGYVVKTSDFRDGELLIQKGKKTFARAILG